MGCIAFRYSSIFRQGYQTNENNKFLFVTAVLCDHNYPCTQMIKHYATAHFSSYNSALYFPNSTVLSSYR